LDARSLKLPALHLCMSPIAFSKLRYIALGCALGFLLAYLTVPAQLPCPALPAVPKELSPAVQAHEVKDLPRSRSDETAALEATLTPQLPLPEQIPAPPARRHVAPRHVYFDMGANWANTLRLFKQISSESERNAPYEVYAFEANPFIQTYVDNFIGYLNGDRPKPPLTVPPAGSHAHLEKFTKRYKCPGQEKIQAMNDCMDARFAKQIETLPLNHSLSDSNLVASRMAEAIAGPSDGKDRYTFIPAAVGHQPGALVLSEDGVRRSIIRGGKPGNSPDSRKMKVPIVDVVSWMVKHFREEDYLVLKMDAEGAEHDIFDALLNANKFGILDVIAYECHPAKSDKCNDLNRRVDRAAKASRGLVLREGNGKHSYQGIDRYSTADKYFPIDPH